MRSAMRDSVSMRRYEWIFVDESAVPRMNEHENALD